jgi:hypothetical protein
MTLKQDTGKYPRPFRVTYTRRIGWETYLVINEQNFSTLQDADAFFLIHSSILMQLNFSNENE